MSINELIFGIVVVVSAFVITWPLAELIIPQPEIDKIDAIGKWAKEELEHREKESRFERKGKSNDFKNKIL